MHAAGLGASAAQPIDHLRERAQLLARGREVGLVRAREVRHDARERERGIAGDVRDERLRFSEGHSHPPHPGIDLDVHRHARPAAALHGGRERRAAALVVQDRDQLARHHLVRLRVVAGAREHEQRRRDAGVAQRDRLADAPGRELAAARRGERARHRCSSVPVGVGLHHRDHAAARREAHRLGVVRAQRVQIDRRDRRTETPRGCQRDTSSARSGTRAA